MSKEVIDGLVEFIETYTTALKQLSKLLQALHEWCKVLSKRIERLEEIVRTKK
jgi:seryl-tRNA(Sec) selenium transferase